MTTQIESLPGAKLKSFVDTHAISEGYEIVQKSPVLDVGDLDELEDVNVAENAEQTLNSFTPDKNGTFILESVAAQIPAEVSIVLVGGGGAEVTVVFTLLNKNSLIKIFDVYTITEVRWTYFSTVVGNLFNFKGSFAPLSFLSVGS